MADEPAKLDLRSLDILAEKRQELLRLFPEIRTEDGQIDFERLKLALGEAVDTGRERYGLTWPGKAAGFKTIQSPSLGTLLPCPEESVDFDTTENLIIEGDNLEVLKLLQKSYLGRVKMIYIDPPYNTGNDFIYPDNYTETLQTYLEYTGQVDSAGRRFGTNADTDGRFHSRWLNMMYPRLYLARNLLREDGVIFISIDDGEADNLKKICDEIFGEENFVENIIWKKRYGGGAKEKHLVSLHEFILVYSRDINAIGELFLPYSEKSVKRYYTQKDKNFESRGPYRTHPLEATKSMGERKNLVYPIKAPDSSLIMPKRQWLWSKKRVDNAINNDELEFIQKDDEWSVHTKQYLRNEEGEMRQGKAFSIIEDIYTQHGTNEIIELFGDVQVFPFPKPKGLFRPLLQLIGDSEALILDFFAGSGAIAHAVLDLNAQDNGNRKFILVQLPEPTGREDYPTIADITKERVRRVIQKLNDEDDGKLDLGGGPPQDRGFRVFRLAESNFKTWNADIPHYADVLQEQLKMHVEHVRENRSPEDILYEILLKGGYPLTTPVETLKLGGQPVSSIAGGELLVCLEPRLTMETIRAMAAQKPQRVVCLDRGFEGNDQLKANAVQIFRNRGVISFKTI